MKVHPEIPLVPYPALQLAGGPKHVTCDPPYRLPLLHSERLRTTGTIRVVLGAVEAVLLGVAASPLGRVGYTFWASSMSGATPLWLPASTRAGLAWLGRVLSPPSGSVDTLHETL